MPKWLQKIKSIPKDYFSLADIMKVTDLGEKSLKVAISRMLKKGELVALRKGVYTLDASKINWEAFAGQIYSPSYLSFEWALARHGVLSQQPANLTLATANRSRKITVADKVIIYHHIQPQLFWGYRREDNFWIAEPEKAFLDLAYLSINGYAKFDAEEMNLKILKKTRIKEYLKKFNNAKLNSLLKRFKAFK
jgi:predicted transcriptional regulator of viral defense system